MHEHKHCKCCGVVIPIERATWLCDQCQQECKKGG